MTDRFFRATGEPRQFGLRESPVAFAHEAARFAGQAGMPDRALAYDLKQAGVYIFHNWPGRKVFMDGRLEVPDRETFETYVRLENMLNEGRRGWAEPLRRLGEPLILLGHTKEFGAEATLLVDPGWRCVYFDAIASVFLSNGRSDLNATFPGVDFAARHFHDEKWRAFHQQPEGIAEGKALLNLGVALEYREGLSGGLPIVDHALGRTSLSPGDRRRSRKRRKLDAARSVLLEHDRRPESAAAGPGRAVGHRSRHLCLPRPAIASAVRSSSIRPTRLPRRRFFVRSKLVGCATRPATLIEDRNLTSDRVNADELAQRVAALLEEGRFEAVLPCFTDAEGRGIVPDWATSDRVATTLLHLGRPADAQRVWERAVAPAVDSPPPEPDCHCGACVAGLRGRPSRL